MEMSLKKLLSPGRALSASLLVLALAQQAAAQSTPVSDYHSLVTALNAGVTTITNFNPTNSPTAPILISLLTTADPTIVISTNVTIDAGTNSVKFEGNGTNGGTRFFYVNSNASLTLNHLELTGGGSTNGGAVYNAGTLIVSNCLFLLNYATNITGTNGASGPLGVNSDGANGASGGSASGGAIYSTGPLIVSYSIFTNDFAEAGNGGSGGNGGGGFGNGGSAGNGGNAFGGAIYSTGSNNIFYMTEFASDECMAGDGGSGGSYSTNTIPIEGSGGAAGVGGVCEGGALFITGPLFMTNCVFVNNVAFAGTSGAAEVDSNGGGENGSSGGFAVGGGLFITNGVTGAWIQNSIFFFNSCYGGSGGNTALNAAVGGNGGEALGGGVFSGAALTQMSFCTLATNLVFGGNGGTNSAGGFDGTPGATNGWNIYRSAGIFNLSDSILSYDPKGIAFPNAVGVTDAGYNVSSDETPARSTIVPTTLLNTSAVLDSGLSIAGTTIGGPFGAQNFTLQLLSNSPAIGLVPGAPGLTFPATDGRLANRRTPTCAGAFEFNPATLQADAQMPTIISTVPGTNFTGAGGSVAFTNTVNSQLYVNPLPFGYQWQFNGSNITDNANYSGTTSNILSVKKITIFDQGEYTVIISPTLLEGATTSSIVDLILTNPPAIQTQPVSELSRPVGSIVGFAVGVLSPLNYDYLWSLNGQSLPNGAEFSGTNSNVLIIDPATAVDAGTYSVIVSNNYGIKQSVNVRLTIVPDKTRPTVTILSPVANERTNNFIIEGTATDNAQVTNVLFSIKNINSGLGVNPVTNIMTGNAVLTTNGNTNLNTSSTTVVWTITNALLPGTNILSVQSVDFSSNVSTVVTRSFFYQVPATLSLTSNIFSGAGTLTGHAYIKGDTAPSNNAVLNIGEGYYIVAAPNSTSLLGAWTNTSGTHVQITNGATFKFIMESNTSIQALFVNNSFLSAQVHGTYNGLFYVTGTDAVVTNEGGTNGIVTNEFVTNDIELATAGMIDNLVLGTKGTFTGKLLLAGGSYALNGAFSALGSATNQIARSAALGGPLIVAMNVDTNGSGIITGTVTNANWPTNATLTAEQSGVASGTSDYTLLMFPPTNALTNANIPPGYGYALIADHAGKVTFSGGLADGTTFSQSVPASRSNDVPVYVSLYTKTGFLFGWLNLTDLDSTNAAGSLAWIKGVPAHPSVLFPGGFSEMLQTEGSPWVNPGAIVLPASNTLSITSADLDLNYTAAIEKNDVLEAAPGSTNSATNSLTGTINLKTGQLQVTFGNGAGKSTTKGYGAMLQNMTNAGGYFVTKTNAGSITLQP
jgi:hypothetical protein